MNKPNKTELEYFIRYSLDSDKYKRYMELYDEIERLNNIIKKGITKEMKDELDLILKTNQKQAHKINKAIEYIDRRDIEWGSEEHKNLLDILKGVDEE